MSKSSLTFNVFYKDEDGETMKRKIESKNEGCDINVTARLNMFASIFFLIWSIGAIVPLIIGIIEPIFLLASLGFAIVITLLILLAFYKPAKNTIALLNSILRK